MAKPFLKFQQVNFTYETAVEPLFQDVSVHLPSGWAGIVGANGAGKTTFLKLATGLLTPNAGMVQTPAKSVYCPQRTDDLPEHFAALLHATSKTASLIKGQFGLKSEWLDRWPTLSHGERKRSQIAVALWLEPDLLAIDEPTNHMDLPSIECLEAALADCPCCLVIVSHDRPFLEKLTRTEWRIGRNIQADGCFVLRVL